MPHPTADQMSGQDLPELDPRYSEEGCRRLIRYAAQLLDEQGHGQAAAVMRSATRLLPPACEARFSGRWTVWTEAAVLPAQQYEIAQQIKRALNTICGIYVSYADLFAAADGAGAMPQVG